MLSKEFEVLTPLVKIHRISRQIAKRDTFEIEPGMWVMLNGKGQVENITSSSTLTAAVELCLNSAVTGDLAKYEGNDTKVGRITTIMEPGVRVYVGNGLIEGAAPAIGDAVYIDMTDVTNPATDSPVGAWTTTKPSGGVQVGIITRTDSTGAEIRLVEPKL